MAQFSDLEQFVQHTKKADHSYLAVLYTVHTLMALLRSFSCSMLLEQLTQLQLLQNSPLAKQSQYL